MSSQTTADVMPAPTRRQTASPLSLLISAIGGPRQWAGKITRFFRTVALYFNRREVRRRLTRLQSLGFMETIPSTGQLVFGGLDMVRYFIAPGAKSYYDTQNINFSFHQVLRFFDDPVSVIDPVGVMSDKDTIIGHILQVTHANPIYDLQILDMFEDGLQDLRRQTAQMVAGDHPRQQSIGAIIEDPTYHGRLLDYIDRYLEDPAAEQMIRETGQARQDKDFVLAELSFSTLPGFMQYAIQLPTSLRGLLGHYRQHSVINPDYCQPDKVRYVAELFEREAAEARSRTTG